MDRLRLAVFDCDGTLLDSQRTIIETMHQAFIDCDMTRPAGSEIRRTVGLPLLEAVARLCPDQSTSFHQAITDRYRDIAMAKRDAGTHWDALYPGAVETIHHIHNRGWLLGIATGKSTRGLREDLKNHDLTHYFLTLQTADTAAGKPNPGMVDNAIAESGVAQEDVVMIGDTVFDMQMAANAGVTAIGVAWGYHQTEELKDAGAVVIVHNFDELTASLERMWDS